MSENLKHRLRYGWLLGCLLAAAALLLNPGQQDASSTTALPSLQPVSIAPPSPAATGVTSQNIETIRLGQRVLGQNPLWEGAEVVDPDVQSWRRIALRMNLEQGDVLNIELLRPLWWIHAHEVRAGELIDLHLEELGASGPAQVIEIGLCPAIDAGPGSVVTGTFAHTTTQGLVRLSLSGSNEPILVTPSHSFWSETRQDFVPAEDLKPNEELLRYDDTTIALQSIEYVNSDVPVFNIEVHGQHVYHVSTAGVLVHNSCYQTPGPNLPNVSQRQPYQYHTYHAVELAANTHFLSDSVQFRIANKELIQRMNTDSSFRKGMLKRNPELLEWMSDTSRHSNSPPGLTWHHDEQVGMLKLVDRGDHSTNHGIYHPTGRGGRDIWGGGKPGRIGKLNPDGTPK